MTQVLAKYRSKILSRHPVQKFVVKIDNCKVELESRQQELIIQIHGKSGEEKTRKLLSDLENLIFFIWDHFLLWNHLISMETKLIYQSEQLNMKQVIIF